MGSWVDGLADWRIGGFTNAKEVGFTVSTGGLPGLRRYGRDIRRTMGYQ